MSNAAIVAVRAAALDEAELETRLALAGALTDAAEYEAALEHLDVLRRARPYWHSFRYEEARALLLGRADADGALAAVDACLAIRPDHTGCNELRGNVLLDLGRRDEAIVALEAALALEPGRLSAAETLARALLQTGRFDDAAGVATQVMAQRGRSVGLLLVRATAHERAGRLDDARRDFEAVAWLHADSVAGRAYLDAFERRVAASGRGP